MKRLQRKRQMARAMREFRRNIKKHGIVGMLEIVRSIGITRTQKGD